MIAVQNDAFSRRTLLFEDPMVTMESFSKWQNTNCKSKPMFCSDNNGFDWQFINWYFHHFIGSTPFGFSSNSIVSSYKGMGADTFKSFKHLSKTPHTHNPVDDAIGKADALLHMKGEMGLKISLK